MSGHDRDNSAPDAPRDAVAGESSPVARWYHRLAVTMALLTFPLIWVGGLVTTYDAGMAVPDWPSTYGYNLFLYPWSTWLAGPWDLFIEHGHRLLASLVGFVAIALVVVAHRQPSVLLRRLAWGALALVLFQGALGGARVLLDERLLAMVHGCVGPLFFLYAILTAVVSGAGWAVVREHAAAEKRSDKHASESGGDAARLAWITLALAYLQLVLGAQLRHVRFDAPPTWFRVCAMFHVVVAIALLAHVALLSFRVLRARRNGRAGAGSSIAGAPALAWAVCGLVACQVALGIATWTVKYHWPTWLPRPSSLEGWTVTADGMVASIVVTLHVATGSLILGTLLGLSLVLTRRMPGARPLVLHVSNYTGDSTIDRCQGLAPWSFTLPATQRCQGLAPWSFTLPARSPWQALNVSLQGTSPWHPGDGIHRASSVQREAPGGKPLASRLCPIAVAPGRGSSEAAR